jgi:hypothetical protein
MKLSTLVLSLVFLVPIVNAQETKPILKEKASEHQKRCVENPKACEDQKTQRKQNKNARKEWCEKYPVPCQELKPIQAKANSSSKREARQIWCKKHSEACTEWKKITQTTPQSKQ